MSEILDIMATRAGKKLAADERKADRLAAGIVNKLAVDRQPDGLYTCRYSGGGPIPEELRGRFTHKQRILTIAERRQIPLEA